MGRGEHSVSGEVPAEYKIGREGKTVQPSDAPIHRQKKEKFIKTDEINPENVVEREGRHFLNPEETLLAKERGEMVEENDEHLPSEIEQEIDNEFFKPKKIREAESEAWKDYYTKVGHAAPKVSEGTRHLENVHEKKVGEVPRRLEKKHNRARHRIQGGKPKGAHSAKVPPYKTEPFREVA